MTGVRDFVAGLAREGKSFKDIQETVKGAFRDQALKKTQIYEGVLLSLYINLTQFSHIIIFDFLNSSRSDSGSRLNDF